MPSDTQLIAELVKLVMSPTYDPRSLDRFIKRTFFNVKRLKFPFLYKFTTPSFQVTLSYVGNKGVLEIRLDVTSKKNPNIQYAGTHSFVRRSSSFLPQWAKPIEEAFGRKLKPLSKKKMEAARTILSAFRKKYMFRSGLGYVDRSRAHVLSNGSVLNSKVPLKNRLSTAYLNWVRNPTPIPNLTSNIPKNGNCSRMFVLPQRYSDGEICWFVAVVHAILFSQRMRKLAIRSLPGAFKTAPRHVQFALHRVAQLLHAYTHGNNNTLVAFDILTDLHASLPKQFDDNKIIAWQKGWANAYVKPFLDLLHISHFHIDKQERRYYFSRFNGKVSQQYTHRYNHPPISPYLPQHPPEVLVVHDINTFDPRLKQTLHEVAGVSTDFSGARFMGTKYIADSALLTSVKSADMHDIAGITCGGRRFLMNGWEMDTNSQELELFPCRPMSFDWTGQAAFEIDNPTGGTGCVPRIINRSRINNFDGLVTKFDPKDGRTTLYVREDLAH